MTLTIPYYLHRAVGVHVGDHAVRWVELRRTRRGPRLVTADEEPIRDGDLTAALAALKTRCRPSSPSVATHLDPLHVRHTTTTTPPPDDAAEPEEWAAHQLQRALPAPADPEAFAVRVRLLPGKEEAAASPGTLAFARTDAVAERTRTFEDAGLSPVVVTTLPAAAAQAIARAGRAHLLVLDAAEALLVDARDGEVIDVEPLGPVSPEVALEEAEHRAAALAETAPSRRALLSTVSLPADLAERATAKGWNAAPIPVRGLSPEHSLAAALALGLLRQTPALDFLPPDDARRRRMQREREAATSYTLGVGIALLLVLAALICGESYLGVQGRALDAELEAAAPRLATIRQAEAERDRLRAAAARAAEEAGAPSGARTLETLGRLVPERLWLTGLSLDPDSSGARLTLEGMTRDDGEDGTVTVLLERLEEAPAFGNARFANVRLDVAGSAARFGGGYRPDLDPDLQQFRVTAQLVPASTTPNSPLAAAVDP